MYRVYVDNQLIYNPKFENLRIFSPRLEFELNKTGSAGFIIYPDHPRFSLIEKLHSIVTVYQNADLIFRGRILNMEQGFYNEKQVSCEGELAFLCDSVQRPYDFRTGDRHTTISELFAFFIQNHNAQVEAEKRFLVGNITVTDPNNYIVRSDSQYLTTWESINQKLINTNGGYLQVRHEQDGNYIDYLEDFDTISNQTIEFGKNLLDINKVLKGEEIATAIIPLGARQETEEETESEIRLTIADLPDEETDDVCKIGDYVYSKKGVEKYGWIFKTEKWDNVTTAAVLLAHAKNKVSETINNQQTIELTGFDLAAINADISGFRLGSYVPVKTNPHDLNLNFLVRKLTIDLTNPSNNVLTLGTTYLSFTEQMTKLAFRVG